MKLPLQTARLSLVAIAVSPLAAAFAYDYGHTAPPARAAAPVTIALVTPPAVKVSADVLTDARGMTLYTFDKDPAGASACKGECAVKWPPLLAADGARNNAQFTIVSREDGTRQWAYKGKPLYLWVGDAKPGDATGDGVNGVWHKALH